MKQSKNKVYIPSIIILYFFCLDSDFRHFLLSSVFEFDKRLSSWTDIYESNSYGNEQTHSFVEPGGCPN